MDGQLIVMDDIALNTLASTLEITLETSKEETDKKPEKLVLDPNEAEVVAEKKQTNMASKKRKSDEGLASPTDKKIKKEPFDSFELRGSPVLSNVPAPLNALKAQMRENEKEKNKRGRANAVVKKLICSHCKNIFTFRPDFNKHIEEVHLELSKKLPVTAKRARIKCSPCQLDFEEKWQHEKHVDDKHGHKCGHCSSSFRIKSKLEEDKRISHSFKHL